MQHVALKNEDRVLIPRCGIARSFSSRMLGLMGQKGLAEDQALLFPRCNSIHTLFMRFPIDVLFVDKDGVVKDILAAVAPWRFPRPRFGSRVTIEMRAHRAAELGIQIGTRLRCEGVWS